MKVLFTFLSIFLGTSLIGQVTAVDYIINYNCESNLYEMKLGVKEGSATTIPERAQFNAQITVVVPAGNKLEVVENVNPLQNNQMYTGDVPLEWTRSTPLLSPESMPDNDIYPVVPRLAPASFYNDLNAGDEILLFTFTVGEGEEFSDEVRLFHNEDDPNISLGTGGGSFENSFTLGSSTDIYDGNVVTSCFTNTINSNLPPVEAYPNPFSNSIDVSLDQIPSKISLMGMDGKVYWKSERITSLNTRISIPDLIPGVYNLIIEGKDGIATKRLIKQ